MSLFGDGRDERLDAAILAIRLAADPRVTARRMAYQAAVGRAREEAKSMSKDAVIAALIADMPAYIRELLETEDDRYGEGSLAERYARTFWKNHCEQAVNE